jgi:hypothetical protein
MDTSALPERLVDQFCAEASKDLVGLWEIARLVDQETGPGELTRGLRAGAPPFGGGVQTLGQPGARRRDRADSARMAGARPNSDHPRHCMVWGGQLRGLTRPNIRSAETSKFAALTATRQPFHAKLAYMTA